ncbi:hypothetical protein FRC03_009553 [Tulasnella sp. 419]|nr:hypothetical protein FRC03_009553 [Tulasnella sp. 419]
MPSSNQFKIPYFKRTSLKYLGAFVNELQTFVRTHPDSRNVLDGEAFDRVCDSYTDCYETWKSYNIMERAWYWRKHRVQMNTLAVDLETLLATFKDFVTPALIEPYHVPDQHTTTATSRDAKRRPSLQVMRRLRRFANEVPQQAQLAEPLDSGDYAVDIEMDAPPPYRDDREAADMGRGLTEVASNSIMPPRYQGQEDESSMNSGGTPALPSDEQQHDFLQEGEARVPQTANHLSLVTCGQKLPGPISPSATPLRVGKGGLAKRVLFDLAE